MPEKQFRVFAGKAGINPASDDPIVFRTALSLAQKWASEIGRSELHLVDKRDGYAIDGGEWQPCVDYYFSAPSAYERNLERLALTGEVGAP